MCYVILAVLYEQPLRVYIRRCWLSDTYGTSLVLWTLCYDFYKFYAKLCAYCCETAFTI